MIEIQEQYRQALDRLGYNTFTDVQKQVLPPAIQGRDVFVHAPAGSGKTLSYVLPVLNRLTPQGKGKHKPCALILCPTRELCIQVASLIRSLLFHIEGYRTIVLSGGVNISTQIRSFSNGADIVVGTPSRILDHIRRHTLKTSNITQLIIDEADEMLNMGFVEDVKTIIHSLEAHQTMMLSATWKDNVQDLCQEFLNDPAMISIKEETVLPLKLKVHLLHISDRHKLDQCTKILQKTSSSAIIFTNRKATADFVCENMKQKGFLCASIHSDMVWKTRKTIMEDFRSKKLQVLCSTAVGQRGLDVPSVKTVILYDIPDQQQQLIHAACRTGRADHTGETWLLCNEKESRRYNYKSLFPSLIIERNRRSENQP